jgi:cell division protein FtsB
VRRPSPRAQPTAERSAAQPSTSVRDSYTGRAAVLGIVVIAVLFTVAYPLRQYLRQRSEIGQLQAAGGIAAKRVGELEAERQRLQDPTYIKEQARQRLRFVMPGERQYTVIGPDVAPNSTEDTAHRSDHPWYGDLWASVREADRQPAAPPTPSAASTPAPITPGVSR